jgi:hypothetical protein
VLICTVCRGYVEARHLTLVTLHLLGACSSSPLQLLAYLRSAQQLQHRQPNRGKAQVVGVALNTMRGSESQANCYTLVISVDGNTLACFHLRYQGYPVQAITVSPQLLQSVDV